MASLSCVAFQCGSKGQYAGTVQQAGEDLASDDSVLIQLARGDTHGQVMVNCESPPVILSDSQ